MIFRQLFDSVSSTYTYLLASRRGGEALIVDPVIEKQCVHDRREWKASVGIRLEQRREGLSAALPVGMVQ